MQKSVASRNEKMALHYGGGMVVVVAQKTGADSKYINRLEVKVAFYIIKFAPSWQNSLCSQSLLDLKKSLFPLFRSFFDHIDMRSVKNH